MASYNTIRGLRVKYLSADPATSESGQVWYNSTTGSLRAAGIIGLASWSAGGNLGSARTNGCSGGLQNSALYAGGGSPGGATELYNGTAWTGSGAMNTNRFGHRGAGTQTSYIMAGNDPSTAAESFNGSAWSNETAYPTSVSGIGAAGTDAAAVFFAGGAPITSTFYWNGSAWSDQSAANQGGNANSGPMGAGQSDAVYMSPTELTGVQGRTQVWDGSSWTSVGTSSLQKSNRSNMGTVSTNCVAAGGAGAPYSVECEAFNGTSWSSTASLASPKGAGGGAGTGSAGLAFGGNSSGSPDVTAKTEEFTGPVVSTQTVTTS
jgi:hypothetical protein